MSSSSDDDNSSINENGRCKVHPIILIKRRRRNGEWSQILKECPLCRADDEESVWSASCSSSSRTSRSSDAQQQQQYHRKRPPSPPPQVSAFKEIKEDEPSPESRMNYQFRKAINGGRIATADEVICESDEGFITPEPVISPESKMLQERVSSGKQFPLLPFSEDVDLEKAAETDVMEAKTPPRTASLKLKIQSRKEKVRELKIRRLVPPSQRYHQNCMESLNSQQIADRRSSCPLPSTTECVGGSKRVYNRGVSLSSVSSEASHHMGEITSSLHSVNLTEGEGKIDLISVPNKLCNSTNGKHMCPLPSGSAAKPTRNLTIGKSCKAKMTRMDISTLEVSFDSFIEPKSCVMKKELHRENSEVTVVHENLSPIAKANRKSGGLKNGHHRAHSDVTLVHENTSPITAANNGDSAESVYRNLVYDIINEPKKAVKIRKTSSEGNDHMEGESSPLNKATRDIWGGRRCHNSETTIPLVEKDKLNGWQLQSMTPFDEKGKLRDTSRQRETEEVAVEDSDESESSFSTRCAQSILEQKTSPVRSVSSATSLNRAGFFTTQMKMTDDISDCASHPSPSQSPNKSPTESADSTSTCSKSPTESAYSASTCSSYDTLVNEGLDDYYAAFDQVPASSLEDSESEKAKMSSASGSSSSAESSNRQYMEMKRPFSRVDSQGRCINHPHVQLRKKRRIRGWNGERWKTVMINCTECVYEEVLRQKEKNLQLLSGKPNSQSGSDTSATESMTATNTTTSTRSSQHPGQKPTCVNTSDGSLSFSSIDSEGTTTFSYLSSLSASSSSAEYSSTAAAAASPSDSQEILRDFTSSRKNTRPPRPPPRNPPRAPTHMLRKPSTHGLSFLSTESNESGSTTTFSSVSAGSSSAEFSTDLACSSSTDGAMAPATGNRRPVGILRKYQDGKKRRSSIHSASALSKSSRSSGRVVFAGRDHIISIPCDVSLASAETSSSDESSTNMSTNSWANSIHNQSTLEL